MATTVQTPVAEETNTDAPPEGALGDDNITESDSPVEAKESTEVIVEGDPDATETAPEADAELEDTGTSLDELDDETIEELAEVYHERLLKTEALKSRNEESVRQSIQSREAELTRTHKGEQRVVEAASVGRAASQQLGQVVGKITSELEKASNQKDFSSNPVTQQEYQSAVGNVAGAVAMLYDARIEEAADIGEGIFGAALPELESKQKAELTGIRTTFERMRGDPNQAARATSYLFKEMLGFAAQRGIEAGAHQEQTKSSTRKSLQDKIASRNAIKVAKAQQASEKTPPRSPRSSSSSAPTGMPTMADYRAAKKAEDVGEIDRIVDIWSKNPLEAPRE